MQIRNRALRLKAERGLDLIVVDSELIAGVVPGMRFENPSISEALRSMAREVNVPLMALSRLSRAAEREFSPLPGRGPIELEADVAVFIFEVRPPAGEAGFMGASMVFAELDRDELLNGPDVPVRLSHLKRNASRENHFEHMELASAQREPC